MKCEIKGDPSRLPVPKLPPTKAVNIGADKDSYIPTIKPEEIPDKKTWTERDERILLKLKTSGMKEKDIAKKMGRTLDSIKWKAKTMRKKGVL